MAKKQKVDHYLYEIFDKDEKLLLSKKSTKKLSDHQVDKIIDTYRAEHGGEWFTVRRTKKVKS